MEVKWQSGRPALKKAAQQAYRLVCAAEVGAANPPQNSVGGFDISDALQSSLPEFSSPSHYSIQAATVEKSDGNRGRLRDLDEVYSRQDGVYVNIGDGCTGTNK